MPFMAQRIVTELTDDTDGKPADETITFALDGREYEMCTAGQRHHCPEILCGKAL